MAQEVADMYGYPWETFPANWSELGKAAGPIRNRAMVNTAPDLCLAFIRNGSKGASGCADMAQKARIRTFIYPQID